MDARNDLLTKATYFLFGAVFGAMAALVIAPETRSTIKERVRQAKEVAEKGKQRAEKVTQLFP